MSTSPRRPARDPRITRQYEPSRLQDDSLVAAYEQLLPILSRRLGPRRSRLGGPVGADPRADVSRPSVAGA